MAQDAAIVQKLLENCDDYYQLVEGRSTPKDAAQNELKDVPPEKVVEDLHCFGIFTLTGELVCILMAIRGFRTPKEWYLSLLLIRPDFRQRGLGREVYYAFENWVQSAGAEMVLLATVGANGRAARFWESLGFEESHRFSGIKIGNLLHNLIEFKKPTGPQSA